MVSFSNELFILSKNISLSSVAISLKNQFDFLPVVPLESKYGIIEIIVKTIDVMEQIIIRPIIKLNSHLNRHSIRFIKSLYPTRNAPIRKVLKASKNAPLLLIPE